MKVYVDKKMMGRENYPKLLEEFKELHFIDNLDSDYDIEVMVLMNSTLKKIEIEKYPKLKWIQLLMAGYDNVNIDLIKSKGIMVSNAQDVFSTSIAEDVFSKILFFNRNTKHYLQSMHDGNWEPIKKEPEIYNSIVSILGTGSIGKEIAKRMKAFGAKKIYGYKQKFQKIPDFDEIFTDKLGLEFMIKECDYLIIAIPLNPSTKNLINKENISLMKKEALIINVARGEVINQNDWIEALKQKDIRGAGLDVTVPEPLPVNSELWKLENVFITPHNASSSPYMKDRLYNLTKENLKKYLEDKNPKYQI